MREAVRRDGVETLEPEIGNEGVLGGRVAFEGSADVRPHLRKDFRVRGDGFAKDAEDDRKILTGRGEAFARRWMMPSPKPERSNTVALQHRSEGRFGLGDDGRAGPPGSAQREASLAQTKAMEQGVSHRQDSNSWFSVNLATHRVNSL
jgi:hypothetical protein